ncbi:Rieske (2Fe-2S) protein [Oscillatoria amoena NRMC-F 0135]|nr:Rieske (2Fe-2S) protein [Oscillatoria amoena NRMC-F 0135]MDL5053480.1 Rieske (2Fe-2S) protein [Oscillatoria laete-virens NRMC-F 0139]
MKNDNTLPPKPACEVDFPVERVEAEHVSRREFAKFLCLVSGGLAVGSGWVAIKDKLFPPFRIEGEAFVCSIAEVAVGGTHPFRVPGSDKPYILIRPSENEWFAYEQKCTHLACAVFYSPQHGKIECPCHNGFFDAKTGQVLQGPPPRPLPRLDVIVREDKIFVTSPPEPKGTA